MKKNVARRFAYCLGIAGIMSNGVTIQAANAAPAKTKTATKHIKEETEPAASSLLSGVNLPSGAERLVDKNALAEVHGTLSNLIKSGGAGVRPGRAEVLAWRGEGYTKARSAQLMKQAEDRLITAGWTVQSEKSDQGFTLLSVIKEQPAPRAIIGFWIPADDGLLLAWQEMVSATAPNTTDDKTEPVEVTPAKPVTATAPAATDAIVHNLDAAARVVNVMKNAMPKIPAFSNLAVKPGFVRGFVKDTRGQAVVGARLGVRSTAVGGAYSGAQGKTDAKGYYEIAVPFGAAHFYNAGHTVDYADGRAALGLHPADGELDGFASNVGAVENFVLLPYGIANRDDVQENPQYSGNYYGGSIVLSWDVADSRPIFANDADLPANSQIEFTLTPQSPLLDGSASRTIVLRKSIGEGFGQLYIVNIPATTYRVSAKLGDGSALKLKEVGPNGGTAFGLEPKEATSTADLLLRPGGAKADMATAGKGNWNQVAIKLSR